MKHISGVNHPIVTLFTDQQIVDLKRFCCKEEGTALSIDKTYNLGDFHVTPTIYKDLSVIRRCTIHYVSDQHLYTQAAQQMHIVHFFRKLRTL